MKHFGLDYALLEDFENNIIQWFSKLKVFKGIIDVEKLHTFNGYILMCEHMQTSLIS